ncbi:F-box/FBD/LRR-repeat protein At1g13570-like [Rutidosis leptorrhynchoides]|uniref:F-box/FBD/LRR-repeat protein At1g13570-like n=1 Tax=Rutidosis leptorrhynchoides TaxID=125765 RepID=UPI003A992575
MKIQCLDSDRISSLPQNIIENVLILIPIRDAVKTSILSKKWRYCWTSMPKLAFHDKMVEIPSDVIPLKEYAIVSAIFNVLLLHTGPILEFEYVGEIRMDYGFDQILLYLSRNKIVKKCGMPQKLPAPIVHLKYLILEMYLTDHDQVSSTLCLLKNAPNLEKVHLTIFKKEDAPHISVKCFDFDYPSFNFDSLEELEMIYYVNAVGN